MEDPSYKPPIVQYQLPYSDEEMKKFGENLEYYITHPDEWPVTELPHSAPVEEYSEEEYSTEPLTDDIPIITEDNLNSILITDLKSLRQVIATKVSHKGGQLSRSCLNHPGFIAFPLQAIGMLRFPDKRHLYNPKVFCYIPTTLKEIKDMQIAHPDLENISNIINNS